jgi:Uma2 family endonuclease
VGHRHGFGHRTTATPPGTDKSWVRRQQVAALSAAERRGFAPLCPDFVVELSSPTDRPGRMEANIEKHLANGAVGQAPASGARLPALTDS